MGHIFKYFIIFLIIFTCCVDPPEYGDGLLENIPAVINETDYFSLSVMGLDYTEKQEWDLVLSANVEDEILTTIIIKNLNIGPSDSPFLHMLNDEGDTIFVAGIFSNFNFTSIDSIQNISLPDKIIFNANNFTGNLDCQLILK